MTTRPNSESPPYPPQEEMRGERLLTLPETASLLGVSVSTLRKWRERGTMPFPTYLIGNQLRFKESEVWKAVDATKHRNTAEALALRVA